MAIPPFITYSFLVLAGTLFISVLAIFHAALRNSGLAKPDRIKKVFFAGAAILLWILFVSFLSTQNFLNNFSALPPRMALVLIPPLIAVIFLLNNTSFVKLLDHIPQQSLIILHVSRLPLGFIFYYLFLSGIIPEQMTFTGRNFDIVIGFTAPLFAFMLTRRKISNGIITAWNFCGLFFLAIIPVVAVLSAPYPFRLIHEVQTNTMIAYFPFVLMPGFVIPLLFAIHTFSLLKSLKKQILLMKSLNDLWFRIIGVPLITILVTVILHSRIEFFSFDFLFFFLVSLAYTISLWYGDRLIIVEIRSRFPDFNQTLYRNLIQMLFVTLFTVTAVTIMDLFVLIYIFHKDPTLPVAMEGVILGLIISFFMLIVYESIYFFQKWRDNMFEAEELKRMQLQNKLDSLKTRVNPHFLFNSLNSLSLLIREDKSKSISFVQEMSNVYRYILQSNENDLSTIEKEIQFVRSFMFLQRIRFDDHVSEDIQVDEKYLKYRIPSLTLQALVENALKHNVVSAQKPLHIGIRMGTNNLLEVTNNLQKKNQLMAVNSYGLANIKRRYEIHGVKGMRIEESFNEFKVLLPLINPLD